MSYNPLNIARGRRIYKAIASFGEAGATVCQVLKKIGDPGFRVGAVQTQVYALKNAGYLREHGFTSDPDRTYRGDSSVIYAATEKLSLEQERAA